MSNTNLSFRGQMEDEEIIKFTRKHWITVMPDLIPFLFYLAVIAVFLVNLKQFNLPSLDVSYFQLIVVLGLLITAFSIHRFFMRLINYFMSVTIITNYRIVELKKTIFMQDTKESLDMRQIQDIQLQQNGLIRNMLKFGNLLITLGTSETRTIYLIPNADYFFRLINKLKNELILKRYNTMLNDRQQKPLDNNYDNNFPYLLRTGPNQIESRDKIE